ncbi:hypothetical protein EVAR_46773_1 [Eumeta japonica]|uniref:Uncharacterized protein n=1 Tax=Eumeta variegata TaxID=151549 RepID=A0A4C1XDR7_EUMVA|nr:hypothetical protein EVAR_46773_1 [Eumeta japonica]
MAVRIATGAVAHTVGSEGFAIGCRSRHNFPLNIGWRFLPYKAMNLFPGRVLGKCRVQPVPVARSLITTLEITERLEPFAWLVKNHREGHLLVDYISNRPIDSFLMNFVAN